MPMALAGFGDHDVARPERFFLQAVVALGDHPPVPVNTNRTCPPGW